MLFSPDRLITRRGFLGATTIGAAMFVAGCEGGVRPASSASSGTVSPSPFVLHPELLVPISVKDGAQMLLYQNGVVINHTKAIGLATRVDFLNQINTDPVYGINLTTQDQNITHIFPQSLASESSRAEAAKMVEEDLPLVLSALQSRLGINGGRARYSEISLADIVTGVSKRNPNLPVRGNIFRIAVGYDLSYEYLGLTRQAIFDPKLTTAFIPDNPTDRIILSRRGAYPFMILSMDTNYLTATGVLNTIQ